MNRFFKFSTISFFFILLLLGIALPVYAEKAYETIWTKQWGAAGDDRGIDIAVDGSGNVYVTGYTYYYDGLDGNTNAGYYDIFLTKYNSSGNKQWTKQWGTSSNDFGKGVTVDGSGNIYVTGYTNGDLDGNTNAGYYDIFLTKYSSSGNKQWTKQWGTAGDDRGIDIAVDGSDNVYVTGYTYGSLDGNIDTGSADIFLTKYDSSGNKQWTKQMGTSKYDEATDVAVDTNGNVYITGYTSGGLDGNTNQGLDDIFLVKYDTNGTKLWTNLWGTSDYDYGNSVAVDNSGNVYVTGYTYGSLDGNTNSSSYYDIFLTKYSSSGNKQWTKQWGTSDWDSGNCVIMDGSGNIYVTGFTFGGLDGNTKVGSADIFLTKYDSSGNKLWTKQWGTIYYEYGYGIVVDGSGNIYVTGYTEGDLDGNTNAGAFDIFLTKLSSTSQQSIDVVLTAPTTTTVSKGSVLGPFSVSITNNTSSSYSIYVSPYLYDPYGNWISMGYIPLTLSANQTLNANNLHLYIPPFAPTGTYYYLTYMYDTSWNLLEDYDYFTFTVTSSSSSKSEFSSQNWIMSGWPDK